MHRSLHFFVMFAALSSGLARAQNARSPAAIEWYEVGNDSTVRVWLNVRRLRRDEKGIVDGWVERTYPSLQPATGAAPAYRRVLENSLYDCAAMRSQSVQFVYYGPDTATFASSFTIPVRQRDWGSVVPGSYGEAELEAACRLAPKR